MFFKILIPYYQVSMSCFLEEIDPILQNFHVMFFDRDWSHITKFPSQVFEDIDPMLPNPHFMFLQILIPYSIPYFHFMFYGRYWSHIREFQKILDGSSGVCGPRLFHFLEFPLHVFCKRLISNSRFSKCYWTDLQISSAHAHSKTFKFVDVPNVDISQNTFLGSIKVFLELFWVSWCFQR